MKVRFTEPALEHYDALSAVLRARVDKQFELLINNLRHPSIRAKKYDESRDLRARAHQSFLPFLFQDRG